MNLTKWLLLLSLCISIPTYGQEISTRKHTEIIGHIGARSLVRFVQGVVKSLPYDGPMLIFIDSPGGEVDAGNIMISIIKQLQLEQTEVVCVVKHEASSMAFNILSFCDKRLYTDKSFMLVHKISQGSQEGIRDTAKNLRERANQLDSYDEPFRLKNSQIMNLSLTEYDYYADNETFWTGDQLAILGYFNGKVEK